MLLLLKQLFSLHRSIMVRCIHYKRKKIVIFNITIRLYDRSIFIFKIIEDIDSFCTSSISLYVKCSFNWNRKCFTYEIEGEGRVDRIRSKWCGFAGKRILQQHRSVHTPLNGGNELASIFHCIWNILGICLINIPCATVIEMKWKRKRAPHLKRVEKRINVKSNTRITFGTDLR